MLKEYNVEIQKLFLEMLLQDAESYVRIQNIYNAENFDRSLRPAAEFIKQHGDQYKTLPNIEQISAATNVQLQFIDGLNEGHYEWFLEEFENFTRRQELERAILKSADLLEKGEYNPVEKLIKDAIQISLTKDMGTDYWENPRARLTKLKDNNGQVSTGYPSIDKKLYGGFKRGELNIWCAGSGGGKSLFLANLGVNFVLNGLNVIYFTFELSEELVGLRIDSMITGVASKDIFRSLDDVEMKVKITEKKSGGLQIKYLPSGKNCNDLRSYIKEYQVKTGKKPDVLLVDYLDLMMPLSVKVSPSDLFVKDKYVSEELRNLAMETNTVVVTAAQLNRSSIDEIEFDHSHISGGLSKIQTADNVFGIFTSRAMREQGRYQIQFMKTRSSSGVGQKIDLSFDIDSLRVQDLEENETVPTHRNSIYESLKSQSRVIEQNNGNETSKISADVQSTKLKELLNKIKSS
jgi:archaellum biogenesis ATPase FlaH